MSKSLNARCIRRWEVEFKPLCDSKVDPYWRKRDLRGYKVVARDEGLAQALGLNIDASKALPDIILIDLGEDRAGSDMLVVFTEVVATDGPINRERKVTLTRLAIDAGFSETNLAFLTAFIDRSASSFRKAIPELAWGSYAWFVSETKHLIDLRDGSPVKINQK